MLKSIGFQNVDEVISLATNHIYSKSIVYSKDEENYFVIDDRMHGEVWVPLFNEASLCNKYWHIGNDIELPLNDNGEFSGDYFFRYCSNNYNKLSFNYWLDPIQQCLKMGVARFETDKEYEIPLNVYVINGYSVHRKIDANEVVECQLTALPQSLKLYGSVEECFKGNNGMAVESCIPCGTFSVKDNDENFVETPHAIISGKVTFAEMHNNRLTGSQYVHLVMESLGVVYDVVIPENELSMPLEDIKYVKGTFILIGHIKYAAEERHGENYHFEIDGTCTEAEFEERFAPYIEDMRTMKSEFFILELGEHRNDEINFVQTAKCLNGYKQDYVVQYGTLNKNGKRRLYDLQLDNIDADLAIKVFKKICVEGKVPSQWPWENITQQCVDEKHADI